VQRGGLPGLREVACVSCFSKMPRARTCIARRRAPFMRTSKSWGLPHGTRNRPAESSGSVQPNSSLAILSPDQRSGHDSDAASRTASWREDRKDMAIESGDQQPSSHGHGPWWVAAAGGGGGIVAAILQDHTLGWAIVVAFTAWLLHNIVIAWLTR
jgi:hypothetical protein